MRMGRPTPLFEPSLVPLRGLWGLPRHSGTVSGLVGAWVLAESQAVVELVGREDSVHSATLWMLRASLAGFAHPDS